MIKVNFDNPEEQKQRVITNLKKGNMAIIHVGQKMDMISMKVLFLKMEII